jgi:repressor LexA
MFSTTCRRTEKGMVLTRKQFETLRRIAAFRSKRGYSPTLQELADATGVSKITVLQHVRALVEKGALTRRHYASRSIEPTEAGKAALKPSTASAVRETTPQYRSADERRFSGDERPLRRLRFAGYIAAGKPMESVEDREEIEIPGLSTYKDCFVLRVRGESMIGDHIKDGDYVIVEKRDSAKNGETVVVLTESGEATLKRFYREKDRVRLQPSNPEMLAIYVKNARIQGVVIGIMRKY